jgi:hypothetical protein
MPMTKASLDDLGNFITAPGAALVTGEAAIVTQINGISGGGDITQVELTKLQWNISRWTVTATVFGNVMKEFADALKQGANRLS